MKNINELLNLFEINYALIRKIAGLVISLLLSVFVISYDFTKMGSIKPGDIVPVDIKAPNDIKYTDLSATRSIEKIAEERVEIIYTVDSEISIKNIETLESFYAALEERRAPENENDNPNLNELTQGYKALTPFRIFELKTVAIDLAKKINEEGFAEDERKTVFSALQRRLAGMRMLSEDEKILLHRTITHFLNPNKSYDREKTDNLRKAARESIRPVERFIRKGEIIIREGEIIDQSTIDVLNNIGFLKDRTIFYQKSFGFFLLFLFFSMVLILYLHHFNPDILTEEPLVFFIQSIVFFSAVAFKFYDVLLNADVNVMLGNVNIPVFSVFLFPVAAVAMLVTMVVDSKFSILLSSMLAVIGGLIFHNVNFVVIAIIGSIVSVYSIMGAKTRAEQMLSGLYLIITNICMIVALHFISLNFMTFDQDLKYLLRDVVSGFFNGTFSIIFAMGTMPVFEKVFRVTSALRLLELTDLNNKILKNLLEQAPGTYHHSIMVANLAEAAAIEIGADSLITRIGGYYHDIGKIKRPFFFVENLMGKDNQHDDLTPNLSAIIIISHVKDGIEIAKQHNLPEEICDIIREHHGTTLVKYFYEKAKNELGDTVKESQYRYPGPKPQTKESALVMLADSIESATRALSNPSPSSIENLIKKITNDKFIDEQFDECNLTLKEIEKIRNVFSKVLLQMFHKRIEYPKSQMTGTGVLK
ncbi:MAG: HDIG domain-containing metalloprotein [Candidatus Muiribacteriota bacterium]